MKNKLILFLMLGVVALITNSCNKSEDSESLAVTVDGNAYSINGSSITYGTAVSGANTNYTFTITLGSFTLYMYLNSIKTGTYKFSSSYNPGPGFYLPGLNGENYITVKNGVPSRGSIVITASTGSTISGTFSGTLYPEPAPPLVFTDSTTIANGSFNNVQY